MITGKPVFDARSLVELCQQHVERLPESPSERLGRAVSPELESALLACLEKSRAKRPQTARDLAALLDRAPTAHSWTLDDAEAWWGRHERSQAAASIASSATGTTPETPSGPTSSIGNGSSLATPVGSRTSTSGFDQTIAGGGRGN
jgi:hypothetical protein